MGTQTHDGGGATGAAPRTAARRTGRPARALERLRTGTDPTAAAARRAVRVTLAACTGFYVFLYVLDGPVSATYALFSAVSLAALSRIPGTGRQRAAVMLKLLPVACVLVTVGTYLAVRTWTAVAGTLVIGFCLAFVAAAGPALPGRPPDCSCCTSCPASPRTPRTPSVTG
ncbi:Inner membrane protein YccS OS=Streptomyces lavendulae subsp. lavendulae OX=58340 GN=yccS4 PE=4 SV=1 [Streptomyces lavendulae subsp. lavendulae]